MAFDFASWPPSLSQSQVEALTLEANTFALSNGLLYLPKPEDNPSNATRIPNSALHAPFTLFPSPIPKHLFDRAERLQNLYNILYSRIASDIPLLDRVLGREVGVGRFDEFTGTLWQGWKDLRDLGEKGIRQSLQLGLFRSDYMLHAPPTEPISLKQVEFNTISVSFGGLSHLVSRLHHHLLQTTQYFDSSPELIAPNLPENNAVSSLVQGLLEAHRAYGVDSSCILMVVQESERNIFDQKLIEFELLERHNIRVVRLAFEQIAAHSHVDSSSGVLTVSHPNSSSSLEISVVYYRAGYAPSDYPSSNHYETRFMLEQSLAIKCPSIPLQLAGSKKMQEYITQEGVLESLLLDGHSFQLDNPFTGQDIAELRHTWMPMWGLDSADGVGRAMDQHNNLVLKPQREGGGNNVYHAEIPSFLANLPLSEHPAWIAMDLMQPPVGLQNIMVKTGESEAVKGEVVSELGVFGWALVGTERLRHGSGGWLVRTKGIESNEGGVAVGFSVLDSVILV